MFKSRTYFSVSAFAFLLFVNSFAMANQKNAGTQKAKTTNQVVKKQTNTVAGNKARSVQSRTKISLLNSEKYRKLSRQQQQKYIGDVRETVKNFEIAAKINLDTSPRKRSGILDLLNGTAYANAANKCVVGGVIRSLGANNRCPIWGNQCASDNAEGVVFTESFKCGRVFSNVCISIHPINSGNGEKGISERCYEASQGRVLQSNEYASFQNDFENMFNQICSEGHSYTQGQSEACTHVRSRISEINAGADSVSVPAVEGDAVIAELEASSLASGESVKARETCVPRNAEDYEEFCSAEALLITYPDAYQKSSDVTLYKNVKNNDQWQICIDGKLQRSYAGTGVVADIVNAPLTATIFNGDTEAVIESKNKICQSAKVDVQSGGDDALADVRRAALINRELLSSDELSACCRAAGSDRASKCQILEDRYLRTVGLEDSNELVIPYEAPKAGVKSDILEQTEYFVYKREMRTARGANPEISVKRKESLSDAQKYICSTNTKANTSACERYRLFTRVGHHTVLTGDRWVCRIRDEYQAKIRAADRIHSDGFGRDATR